MSGTLRWVIETDPSGAATLRTFAVCELRARSINRRLHVLSDFPRFDSVVKPQVFVAEAPNTLKSRAGGSVIHRGVLSTV